MKAAVALILLALAAAVAVMAPTAYAQPELIRSTPEEGDTIDEAPSVLELCFSEPISAPMAFKITLPDGATPAVSIDAEEDGECVRLLPRLPEEPLDGDYALDWQVAGAGGDSESASGRLEFSVEVAQAEEPSDGDTPVEGGGTDGGGDESPAPDADAGGGAGAEEPAAGPAEGARGGGGVQDILLKALVTTGVAWGVAFVVAVLYLVRRRIGFDPHRPPPADESAAEHH
jgi:methionine-rich copper-binding protein CopC